MSGGLCSPLFLYFGMQMVLRFSLISLIILTVACKHHTSVIATDPVYFDCGKFDTLILEGNFQDKNIYLQNPIIQCEHASDRFSTEKIFVNNTPLPDSVYAASAYEIDLKNMNFQLNDPVKIMIIYTGNRPRVLTVVH